MLWKHSLMVFLGRTQGHLCLRRHQIQLLPSSINFLIARSLSTIYWEGANVSFIFLMCGYNSQVREDQLFFTQIVHSCIKNIYICYTFFLMICLAADVLLWRNKKISASVISGFTAAWVLFEWLNYHFLQLFCFAVAIGMLGQFVLSNASGILNRYL